MVNDNVENVEEKIIDAAADEFEEKGFAGARMQQIADRAGINKALVHYYFRSKEKLFEKVFMIVAKKAFKKFTLVLDTEGTVFEKITNFFEIHQDFLWKNRNFPVFFLNEINRNPQLIKKVLSNIDFVEMNMSLIDQINAEKEQGIIRKDINTPNLMVNIISLSIFPYIGQPVISEIISRVNYDYKTFLMEHRKQLAQFVINSIKA
ncbi:MAG: TetR/AcrR family transcriptional regulator [Marinilabiliales bacterium]|nr:MAG: TetR/AcrR family transcriptional regulator [Marinilabiliales bacterium]